jgi:hypothetical protein
MEVIRYNANFEEQWNNFLNVSKNSTFLFHRSFCEYHAERFNDHSLIILSNGNILAVFPANEQSGEVISHGGLSYGGLVVHKDISLVEVLNIFKALLLYYHQQNIRTIIYKQIPVFYTQSATFEIDYALFLAEAQLVRRDTAFVTDLKQPFFFQERRERSIKKASKAGVRIEQSDDFEAFWNEILSPNLLSKFHIKPVHTAEEITLLSHRFPKNIRQYNAFLEDRLVAGTTIFENRQVAHAQYISANETGKKSGAIDLLFQTLLKEVYKDFDYFSFGISNENQGKTLNQGLADWKEGFGAKVWIHNFYSVLTENYTKL